MKYQSKLGIRGFCTFPEHTGERIYMREIFKHKNLPFDLQRWQPTVDAMLQNIDVAGPIYMMVDQGEVSPEASHRRSGVHVDGYWIPALNCHGGGGHTGSWKGDGKWNACDFSSPEALVLASDVQAAEAYVGEYNDSPGEGGDASHINLNSLKQIPLLPNIVYVGNVSMLHASVPSKVKTKRTLVRLSIPGWSI
jgi:hypothetical protein